MGRASRRKRDRGPAPEAEEWPLLLIVCVLVVAAVGATTAWVLMKKYAPEWSAPEVEGLGGRTPATFMAGFAGAAAAFPVMLFWRWRLDNQKEAPRRKRRRDR